MIAIMSSASRARPSGGTPIIDLTIDTTIDLTNLDDSPPTSPRVRAASPPRKRQKLSNGVVQTPSRDPRACLDTQVKPYVNTYVAELPAGRVDTSKICDKVRAAANPPSRKA